MKYPLLCKFVLRYCVTAAQAINVLESALVLQSPKSSSLNSITALGSLEMLN